MPTYVYEREDGSTFEYSQKITEDAIKTCPTTGQKVTRVITSSAFHLKGSGWYKTDYASPSSSTKENKTSETKSEVKPEPKKSDGGSDS